ncbi:MAG TPA: mannose-1-phosphate guanylyltransferase [Williamwhitmania sp.]|nr:mannose-1-phosphate guanylyltransferase [Williamwhitmania sp.]
MNKNHYCVIMAGGVGSRFWPLSRNAKPKQFLDILGTGRTFIQQTFDRFAAIIPVENIMVVTSVAYKDIVLEQLPEIDESQVLLEPLRRNTAPCIAYANYKILERNSNAVMVVAPSDHLVLNEKQFHNTILQGLAFAEANKSLITIGIKPTRPETGYGYIQINSGVSAPEAGIRKVKTFTEKPNLDMAKIFLKSGEFFWNSGIFIWSLTTILDSFRDLLPEVSSLFADGIGLYNSSKEEGFIRDIYSECRSVSIDYGIMEKADNVYVIMAEFGWSDLGTWGSLFINSKRDKLGNSVTGANVMNYGIKNCLVRVPDEKLVVLQGLSDCIVVESDGILLVCRMDDEQEIKSFVSDILIEKGEQFT